MPSTKNKVCRLLLLLLLLHIIISSIAQRISDSPVAAAVSAGSVRPSVCLYVVYHSCSLLKSLDGMTCRLTGTLVWPQVTLY